MDAAPDNSVRFPIEAEIGKNITNFVSELGESVQWDDENDVKFEPTGRATTGQFNAILKRTREENAAAFATQKPTKRTWATPK